MAKFTELDLKFIADNPGMTATEIAKKLGRNATTILRKAKALGVPLAKERNPWREEDIAQLRKLAGKKSVKEICKILNRSQKSVRSKAYDLNLSVAFARSAPQPEKTVPTAPRKNLMSEPLNPHRHLYQQQLDEKRKRQLRA